MRIGPVVISIGAAEAEWQQDVAIIRAMKPDLIKFPIEDAFSPWPHRIRAVVDELKPKLVVLSGGMQAIEGGWPDLKRLLAQQMETVDAHPEITFVVEIGNEPEYHQVNGKPVPWGRSQHVWGYRYIALGLAQAIRDLKKPNLKPGIAMPVFLDAARDVVWAKDNAGIAAGSDVYLCTHYYGYEQIGDAAGNGKDHNAAWGPIYADILQSENPIIFTEIGIDSPSSTIETKSRRLLDWLQKQPDQVVGAAVWVVGRWKNMELDLPGARVYGARNQPKEEGPVGDTIYGIRGLIDVRNQLPTNYTENHGPNVQIALRDKWGVVVHYDGPPVDQKRSALEIARADAAYHISKVWGHDTLGRPTYGDGLQYHISIGQDGQKLLTRDIPRTLWHCGAWPQNRTALAIHMNVGGDQRATAAALQSLKEVCDDWIAAGHGSRKDVWGHGELSPTSCPGTLMEDFVYPYREGMQVTAEGQWFPETQHYIGGGFYQYWLRNGGIAQFGYPLTDELAEICEDGQTHTVQYFERAVFEYHAGNQPPYDVLLRRLGAEALARKGS